jgi:hypothetical protein
MYTSEEIQTKIDQFLRTSIQVDRTRLGTRDILTMRNEIYDLLTTSILLRPDSFFYIVRLTVNRLEALRRQQATDVTDILESLVGINRRSTPIENTAELSNARAALLGINAGLNARQSGISGALGPGVEKFRNAVERFIDTELADNVIVAGDPTETGDELRVRIQTLWSEALSRHSDMVELVTAIIAATARLESAQLPYDAIQGIVSRIRTRLDEVITELGGSQAIEKSREDMLDLFVMRVLLTRAASFRTPSLSLAPLTGDSATMVLTSGTIPGSIQTPLSGPYVYGAGESIEFDTESGPTHDVVALPGFTNAEMRSIAGLPPSITFAGTETLDMLVENVSPGAPHVFSAAAKTLATIATEIDGYLGAAGTSFVDVPNSQIVIQSADATDASLLQVLRDTPAKLDLVGLLGLPDTGRASPTAVPDIASDIGTGTSDRVVAESVFTDLGSFSGDIRTGAGNERKVFVQNVLSAALIGARVQIVSPDLLNPGYYSIAAVIDEGSGEYSFTVDRDFYSRPDAVDTALIFTDYLKVSAAGAAPTDGIAVTPSTPGALALGFTPSATQTKGLADTATISVGDLLQRGVRVGDLLQLDTESVADAHTLTAVDTGEVSFSPGFTYPNPVVPVDYAIRSARYQSYQNFIDGISSLDGVQSWLDEWEDVTELDRRVTQVIRGGLPGQAAELLQSYLDSTGTAPTGESALPAGVSDLTTLEADVDAFSVPFESMIDNVLRMLSEQGMDRALDLLLNLDLDEFFTMPAEGVSYSTWLTKQSADAARELAPVSKFAKSANVAEEVRPLASQPNPFDPDEDLDFFGPQDDGRV